MHAMHVQLRLISVRLVDACKCGADTLVTYLWFCMLVLVQALAECALLVDGVTGYCTSECVDASQCSMAVAACQNRPIRTEDDLEYYTNCTHVCGLTLEHLPEIDVDRFSAFYNIKHITGQLTVSNNPHLYSLAFFKSLEFVCHTHDCICACKR